MRSWGRALDAGLASTLLLACAGGGGGGDGGRFDEPPASSGAGNGRGSSSTGDGGFGNADGTPPPVFDDTVDDAGNGVNTTDDPDDVKCGGDRFKPEIRMEEIPGNLLLVFDKSASMEMGWGTTGSSKWDDALAAIPAALMPLQDEVIAASIFFPYGESCSVPAPGEAPHIPFMPGPDFLSAWDNFRAATIPGGATPLRSALAVADQYLKAELPNLSGITTVVIVTDGNPNCVEETDDHLDTSPFLTPYLEAWLELGVKSYVVGLPGLEESGLTILSDLAAAGGTIEYIPADDVVTLQTELAKIASEGVTTRFDSCTLPLDMPPPDVDDVNLLVVSKGMENSVDRDLGASGGWTIDAAGTKIVLRGALCDHAKMGEYEEITVVYGCVEAPPLPPPPPVI